MSRWHKYALSLFAGLCFVSAFAPINAWPFLFLGSFLLIELPFISKSPREAFLMGFAVSFAILVGAFYWVTYVIHVFGFMPWAAAVGVFLSFCLIGALNFPIYFWSLFKLNKKVNPAAQNTAWQSAYLTWGIPAVFIFWEWLIPKLFPWYIGHGFYKLLPIIQVCELTGSLFLSYLLMATGGCLALFFRRKKHWISWAPITALWVAVLAFGFFRLNEHRPTRPLNIGIAQANVGSLEKLEALTGAFNKVRYTVDTHKRLSEALLASSPKPDLILWPETALPFHLDNGNVFQKEIEDWVNRSHVALITGGYGREPKSGMETNAAYLLQPQKTPPHPSYTKNVLLAFGEYFPMGEYFPQLYRYFPQVSQFYRGRDKQVFTLEDGTRLGISICYEAIIPSFMRELAAENVHALINLTNDSWFGPTSEPYQHGQLTVFRAVETRLPLVRSTNTGISFTVSSLGQMSPTTKLWEADTLNSTLFLPTEMPRTLYVRLGDWFLDVAVILLAVILWRRKRNVPLSV